MGLKGMSKKDLKDSQTVIGGMEFFGVSEDDLPHIARIAELEAKVASLEESVSQLRSVINDIYAGIAAPKGSVATPQEAFMEYAEPVKEFKPYGI